MLIKQVLYLGHWILKLDLPVFFSFLNFARKKTGRTKAGLILDIIYCVLFYKISIMEFFQYNFYGIRSREERKTYVGTPLLEEYLAKMNPKSARRLLDNKLLLLETYAPFIKRKYAKLSDFQADNNTARQILQCKSGKIVLKWMFGECGKRITIIPVKDLDSRKIIERLAETGNDFVEECVVQHKELMKLSPSAVNTLRIVSQINKYGEVEIIGTILRISVNSVVDNWHAGNIAAPVNIATGIVEGPAFYMDITKPEAYHHPITGVEIVGFKVPYWKESLQLVKEAALHNTENRSIGWDIAVTDDGPDLIEGNNNWDKVLWQRSIKKGLKLLIEPYL